MPAPVDPTPNHSIDSQIPTTFGTAKRFNSLADPFQYTQEALKLSALDYQSLYENNQGPKFAGYSKRPDHFINKDQALEVIQQKEEANLRLQRIQ